ncbi:MAG: NAD(P)/FAD-dependent oxidoreductase [Planctomycetota bacterium]
MTAPQATAAHRTQVAIVGAGPAGIAAAVAAAAAGARVTLVDEGVRPGGQIYRQAPADFAESAAAGPAAPDAGHSPGHARGAALLRALAQVEVDVLAGTTVWDASPTRLACERSGEAHVLECERLILAPGAYDLTLPFPGWTLPGVITAGAAQVMVRGFRVAPGSRALVAGTGPLLLPTVTALLAAGTTVVAAVEANGKVARLRAGLGMLRSRARLREAFHYLHALDQHGVDYRTGWTLLRVDGTDAVASATIGRIDRAGRVQAGSEQVLEVDVVCTGYGLVPSIELARLLGCEMHYVALRGGHLPVHDADMQSSVPGVFVAGEIAGIGGADVAEAEGTIAGMAAARSLGLSVPDEAPRLRAARRARARERRVSDALLAAFSVPPGLYDLADDDTVVCRCEDVSLGQLRATADLFGRDLRSAKMGSRAGMGPCQGRICQASVFALLRRRLGGTEDRMPCPSVQVPVKPVRVATILATRNAAGG